MQRFLHLFVFAVLFVSALSIIAYGSDWLTCQHDSLRSGVTADTVTLPLSLQWSFNAPCAPVQGWGLPEQGVLVWQCNIPYIQLVRYDDSYQVAVAGDCAYFCASGECKIYCIDAVAGSIKWVAFTDAPARCAPTIANGRVYVGADDGYMYCLNASDGSLIWKFNAAKGIDKVIGQTRVTSLWPIRTGVLVDNGKAYFGAGLHAQNTDGATAAAGYAATNSNALALYSVDATANSTPTPLWQNNTVASATGYNLAPEGYLACTSTELVVPAGRQMPAMFNRSTGAFEWQPTGGQFGRSNPNGGSYIVVNGNYIYNGGNAITAYDMVNTAKDQWNNVLHMPAVWCWGKAQQVVVSGTMTYLVTDTDIIGIPSANCVAAVGACTPAGGLTGFATNSSPNYAQCTWRTTGQNVPSALILAGSTLFAGGNGKVAAYDAGTGSLQWSNTTLSGTVRGLAFSNGRLYASTTTGNIYCFGSGSGTAIAPPASTTPYPTDSYSTFYSQTADSIVSSAGLNSSSTGFAVILGGETGRLAYELAKRTNMTIYVLEASATNVAAAKTALHTAGMWGKRVIVWQGALNQSPLPFPPYMANLVVDEEGFFGSPLTVTAPEITRILRPCGGIAFLGQPAGGAALGTTFSPAWAGWNKNLGTSLTATPNGTWETIVRGKLTNSAEWTHQWADAGNSGGSNDTLAKQPFKILWYGDPGPSQQNDRHDGGPAPLVANGRFFIQGINCVMAYDAYNGQFLWNRSVTGAHRVGYATTAMPLACVTDSSVFLVANNVCYKLDAATGTTQQTYTVPSAGSQKWGWVAAVGNTLYGSRTTSTDNNAATSDMIFALDITSGATLWTYTSTGIGGVKNTIPANAGIGIPSSIQVSCTAITNLALAIGDGRVYLADSCPMTANQITAACAERVACLGNYGVDSLGAAIKQDPRLIKALDANTGAVIWTHPHDCCDNDNVTNLACKSPLLLIFGSPTNESHNQDPFKAGNYNHRSIFAFNMPDGTLVWGGAKNYQSRPVVAGTMIYAEPWGYELSTGLNRKLLNGSNWEFFRGWAGSCGSTVGSPNLLFAAGNGISYCDIAAMVTPDTETQTNSAANNQRPYIRGQRTGCAINFIPGGGLIVMPEGSSICTCPNAVQDTVVSYAAGAVPEAAPAVPPTPPPTFHVFYNGSAYDGNDETANASDDAAIATDKSAIIPGGNRTATQANYTSYAKGINGVMIDIWNMPGTPVASDFEFRAGNSNPSSTTSWTLKTISHMTISVRKGAGDQGNDRITLTFPDNAVQNQWLQIRVKANAATNGLTSDLYYIIGNAIGETGNSTISFRVDSSDLAAVRADLHTTFANPAPITDMCDFNRDKKVNTADQVTCRSNCTTITNELKVITVP